MLPDKPPFDMTNVAATQSVLRSYGFLRSCGTPNLADSRLIKLRRRTSFSTQERPMLLSVRKILLTGGPTKVFDAVVVAAPVVVRNLVGWCRWVAKKHQSYQAVDRPSPSTVSVKETDHEVSKRILDWIKNAARFGGFLSATDTGRHALNASKATDGIVVVKWYGFPNFRGVISISHDASPCVRVRAGRCTKHRFRPFLFMTPRRKKQRQSGWVQCPSFDVAEWLASKETPAVEAIS